MLQSRKEYRPSDKMRDMIKDNNNLLMVISRFGISLGFGDKTIQEVCRVDNVDCQTFLAVCNFISGKNYKGYQISLPSLIGYLKSAHSYFLDFILPSIKRKLIEAISTGGPEDVSFLLIKFFDDYVEEVRRHMENENKNIFGYVENLLQGKVERTGEIGNYKEGHDNMALKLQDLKDIFIYHYNQRNNDILNSALFDIIVTENDLMSHCAVEDKIFVPAVINLEQQLSAEVEAGSDPEEASKDAPSPAEALTEREKDIIRCVAQGKSNKEIADHLCLSVHTVATHRRNISAKLEIHSPAALTIFAIINKLIDLSEVKV